MYGLSYTAAPTRPEIILQWNGKRVETVTSPTVGTVTLLYALACRTANDVWAVELLDGLNQFDL